MDYSLVSTLIEGSGIIPKKFKQADKPLPDDVLAKVGSVLHIEPRQVQIAFDIWRLGELEKSIRDTINSSVPMAKVNQAITSMETSYKAMVKRTLLKALRDNRDEVNIESMSVREQKEHLERLFNGALVRYRSILK